MNCLQKWTKLDEMIFKIENKIKEWKEAAREPSVEMMIEAETRHLKKENMKLKKKQYPGAVRIREGLTVCPDCDKEVNKENRFCPECGRRITFPVPSTESKKYATSHKEKE